MDADEMAECFRGKLASQNGGFAAFHRRTLLRLLQDKLPGSFFTAGGLGA